MSGKDQDLNADIAEEAAEIMEDQDVAGGERSDLSKPAVVPSDHPRVSLTPAGDGSSVTQDAPGEIPGEKVSPSLLINSKPSGSVRLLNRAPRLGLSKLEKKVVNLHQISPSVKEE